MKTNRVIIYTDGACRGNPGIGSWAAILNYQNHHKKIYGVLLNTTNNKMELMAAIEALKVLKFPCQVDLFTDSQYLCKGITTWIKTWQQKNWRNVKNIELWQELLHYNNIHNVNWQWVQAHNGNINNEAVDRLANFALDEYLGKE